METWDDYLKDFDSDERKLIEMGTKEELNNMRVKLFDDLKNSHKDSNGYKRFVDRYLGLVWKMEDRFNYPKLRYSAIRCDGTVAFGPCHTFEEELFYLAWESGEWDEPTSWRMMTEAEIARYDEAIKTSGRNPFGPKDF